MFANTQMMGMDFAFPDVCTTPALPPVPVPYPNIALQPMAIPNNFKVFTMGTPAHNLGTVVPMSNGDNAGVLMGVASGTVMGPKRSITGAFTCLITGLPATRLTSLSMQNSTNMLGMSLVPSQFKVIILKP